MKALVVIGTVILALILCAIIPAIIAFGLTLFFKTLTFWPTFGVVYGILLALGLLRLAIVGLINLVGWLRAR